MSIESMVYSLFEKKKLGESDMDIQELLFLERVKSAKLLRALIDPKLSFDFAEGYVPPKLELDLCYAAISGRSVPSDFTVKDVLKSVYFGLQCARDLQSLLGLELHYA